MEIELYGIGHWSTVGEIEGLSEYWEWGLNINGQEIPLEQVLSKHSKETKRFYEEIKSYLPDNYKDEMSYPIHIPGPEGCAFSVELQEFKEPKKVEGILKKFFPKSFENTFNKGVYITHITRRPTEKDVWVPLAFLTQIEGDENYYWGYGFERPFSHEEITKGIEDGALVSLTDRISTNINQTPWLNPDNEIYLANSNNPIGDNNKKRLTLIK